MVSGHSYCRYKQGGVQTIRWGRDSSGLRPLLPTNIASLPTTKKHFDWAGSGGRCVKMSTALPLFVGLSERDS